MRRGQVVRYEPKAVRRDRLIVVVSAGGINDDPTTGWVLAVDALPEDPHDLLAVRITGHGWASARHLSRVYKRWITDTVDVLDADTLASLNRALGAALDL